MFITLNRFLEVFWICKQNLSNPKPIFKIQIKFEEFLEKLSISKIRFSTTINMSTYLQKQIIFSCQRLLIKIQNIL